MNEMNKESQNHVELKPDVEAIWNGLLKDSALREQVGGDHYRQFGATQPITVMKYFLTPEEFRGFIKGTCIKYILRERSKGKDQDLHKVQHYLKLYFELVGISGKDTAKNEN